MIGLGVQTWGTDVAALKRYWAAADELGYARVTYGDGLWSFTHDGFGVRPRLEALARRTGAVRGRTGAVRGRAGAASEGVR